MSTLSSNDVASLPTGSALDPVPAPHFPDALHAEIWRNWDMIPAEKIGQVIGATADQVRALAQSMGLPAQRPIPADEIQRSYMTVIRRNWHLLPYDQLCRLLGWSVEQMRYSLNEDDFMWVKLGGYKPTCERVVYREPPATATAQAGTIRAIVERELAQLDTAGAEDPFAFIRHYQQPVEAPAAPATGQPLRMVYPYFLRFGDALIGTGIDDIPEGYLADLAGSGVNAIWLQGILNTLYPWELAPHLSNGWQERLANLNRLVARCKKFGIDVLLYLNEPRAMPPAFFDQHPELRGVTEAISRQDVSPHVLALCTSTQPVRDFIVDAVRHLFTHVPDLGGAFAITFSENLTNCWSRNFKPDERCPRCAARSPGAINGDVMRLIDQGLSQARSSARLIWYVWSIPNDWVPDALAELPDRAEVMCVSELGTPFTRGDYTGIVNEYSISVVGPSSTSRQVWTAAAQRGLKAVAKIQAANSWEMSSVPYIPALRLVGEHVVRLIDSGVDGLMLGWSLGGAPSPNMELAAELGRPGATRPTIEDAMNRVAARHFGASAAGLVTAAWNRLSDAFTELPFDISLAYNGPQSLGPANPLWASPTGLAATMITFPFDDLTSWRGPYSVDAFQSQFDKLADRWQAGVDALHAIRRSHPSPAIEREWRIADAVGICFRSVSNQIRYIRLRETDPQATRPLLKQEIALARRLMAHVARDSRIGFEATMQYSFTQQELLEKIINCEEIARREE